MKLNKKAQIQMAETIGVLTIFFFLLIFGIGFYVKIRSSSIASQVEEQADVKSVQVAQKVSFMPEFQCSFNNIQKDNCFDIMKIEQFIKMVNDTNLRTYEDYYDILEYSNITLEQVYPPGGKYTIYERVLFDEKGRALNRRNTKVPISIYNASSKTYSFGVMNVYVFSK